LFYLCYTNRINRKINYQKSTLKLRLVVKKLMVQKGYSKAGVR
jgi:hypothetical protein